MLAHCYFLSHLLKQKGFHIIFNGIKVVQLNREYRIFWENYQHGDEGSFVLVHQEVLESVLSADMLDWDKIEAQK